MAAKLKGFDFKQTLIDHGEKIALGVVGLLTLLILVKAPKSTFDKQPDEIVTKAQSAQKRIQKDVWPDVEKQKYPALDTLTARIKQLKDSYDPGPYMFGLVNPVFGIYPPFDPREGPRYFNVERLIADAGSGLFELHTVATETTGDGATDGSDGKSGTSKFKDQAGATGDGAGQSSPLGRGSNAGPGSSAPGASAPGASAPGASVSGCGTDANGEGSETEGQESPGIPGKGVRFVAVRGVFPLARQISEFARALRQQPGPQIAREVQLVGFAIERQELIGRNQWSKWEPVDLEANTGQIKGFLWDSYGGVDASMTDAVITSPLPNRVLLNWAKLATHPDISGYDDSDEAKKRLQRLINEALARRRKAEEEASQNQIEKKGFAKLQYDQRQSQSDLRSDANARSEITDYIVQQSGNNDAENRSKIEALLAQKISATGQLLLFRFFDFDVTPGHTYRYRVQLELKNPNEGIDISQLAPGHHKAAEGKTRKTEWGQPTPPAYVPYDVKYFLTDVALKGFQNELTHEPTAKLKIFQWYTETGTTVQTELKLQYGQFVGGEKKTEVVNPLKSTFAEKEVPFETGDVVVDLEGASKISSKTLEGFLGPDELKQHRGGIELTNQALVVDRYGRLKELDPLESAPQKKQAEDDWKTLADAFAKWKPQDDAADGSTGDLIGELDGGGKRSSKPGGRKRGKDSPTRRGDGGQRRSGRYGSGGGPAGGPPSGGSGRRRSSRGGCS